MPVDFDVKMKMENGNFTNIGPLFVQKTMHKRTLKNII